MSHTSMFCDELMLKHQSAIQRLYIYDFFLSLLNSSSSAHNFMAKRKLLMHTFLWVVCKKRLRIMERQKSLCSWYSNRRHVANGTRKKLKQEIEVTKNKSNRSYPTRDDVICYPIVLQCLDNIGMTEMKYYLCEIVI